MSFFLWYSCLYSLYPDITERFGAESMSRCGGNVPLKPWNVAFRDAYPRCHRLGFRVTVSHLGEPQNEALPMVPHDFRPKVFAFGCEGCRTFSSATLSVGRLLALVHTFTIFQLDWNLSEPLRKIPWREVKEI